MSPNTHSTRQRVHLALGGAAAGLAVALQDDNRWRTPLALVAGMALARGIVGSSATSSSGDVTAEDAPVAPEQVRSARVEGIQMRWEEHGDRHSGMPVVLVHGLPTGPRVWRYVIPQVAREGVPCLAWEQVGFGGSLNEGLGRDLSIPHQAEYLYAWLRHLGIDQAVFVAHDYGGGVLQHLLLAHPELCRGLVLTDCVAYDNWPVTAVRIARAMSGIIERLPPSLVKPFFFAAIANLGHENRKRGTASARLHWYPYSQPVGPKAFAHQLRHFDGRDTLAIAHELPRLNLDSPVRIIWAEKDPLSMASAERLAKDLDAPLQRIPGGRHFTPEDHPEVLAEAINSVLGNTRKGVSPALT